MFAVKMNSCKIVMVALALCARSEAADHDNGPLMSALHSYSGQTTPGKPEVPVDAAETRRKRHVGDILSGVGDLVGGILGGVSDVVHPPPNRHRVLFPVYGPTYGIGYVPGYDYGYVPGYNDGYGYGYRRGYGPIYGPAHGPWDGSGYGPDPGFNYRFGSNNDPVSYKSDYKLENDAYVITEHPQYEGSGSEDQFQYRYPNF